MRDRKAVEGNSRCSRWLAESRLRYGGGGAMSVETEVALCQ